MTKTILVKAATRSAAVQKITGVLDGVVKEAELEAALTNCRTLMNRIDAGLSVKKLSLSISHWQQSFYFILSLPLLLSRRAQHDHESMSRRSSSSIIDAAGGPAPASPRGEDSGSVLK
jgi:hypothetical protein